MANISLPETYLFAHIIKVRIDDINYANHLDFAKLISYLSNCRAAYFKENNYKEIGDDGIGIMTKSVSVDYKKQLHFNDKAHIMMDIQNLKGASVDLIYGVFTKNDNDNDNDNLNEAARGTIKLAFIDYNANRPCKIPEKLINLINNTKRISLSRL